ncbi:MAG: quinone-dependent dihydroorotate dehydrogenase [Alphaproteobacteria bacterium]|nr:quinone-dependent dihydroorotate dehydrogenase [Alphaproteobacteria bacterium]
MAFNPWTIPFIDIYALARPVLFLLEPELAHHLTIKMLKFGLGPRAASDKDDPILKTSVFGLEFSNPVGLAAGLDKEAEAIDGMLNLGFGFAELGGVTPKPQPGNPRPRLFRIPEASAIINRMGFNSSGIEAFTNNLQAWRSKLGRVKRPVGVNLGKNKDSADDAEDFIVCLKKVAPFADFVTINVSSPNTPGLRDIQAKDRLKAMLDKVMKARAETAPELPVLLKISPDITEEQQADIAAIALESKIQGLIISNTSTSRPSNVPRKFIDEAGGLSGPPIFGPSTRLLSNMYKLTKGQIKIIGSGGVMTGTDAYAKIRAGASLVQIYSALIFRGPGVAPFINKELADILRKDGFKSVEEAVGADHRV